MKVVLLCAALALSFVCGGEASLRSNLLSLHLPSQEPQGDAPWCVLILCVLAVRNNC